ncbi:hypothetical protein D9M69_660970 [compost metagenome]
MPDQHPGVFHVGPIHDVQLAPLFPGEMAAAAVGAGNTQRHGAVGRIEVGDLGDGCTVVLEDLRAPELGTGQAQFCRREVEAQARIDRAQLCPLGSFIAGQVIQGFRHIERHVIGHQAAPAM